MLLNKGFLFFPESVAFHWGPKPGLIRYYFKEGERPNTKADEISFGFITPLENAILLRIDSQSSNDYIEFEIVSKKNLFLLIEVIFFSGATVSGNADECQRHAHGFQAK